MDTINKIRTALTGIEEDITQSSTGSPMVTGLVDPPSYIVMLLLCVAMGFSRHTGDKSAWVVHIRYRRINFTLRDWKRSTWSIAVPEESPNCKEILSDLQRKIRNAGKILDKFLASELINQVDKENFYILNSYHKIRQLYEHFRLQVEKTLSECEEAITSHHEKHSDKPQVKGNESQVHQTISGIFDILNRIIHYEKTMSHNACAMVAFFFSYTELLFDILFAFDPNRTLNFKEFRSLSWSKRFKTVLPPDKNPTISRIYQELLDIKRSFRDVILHGFGDEAALLVPLKSLGLVPISYEVLSKPGHFSLMPLSEDVTRRAMNIFQAFDELTANDPYVQYAVLYAQSGLEIPFEPTRLEEIRSWMTSRENFKKLLQNESQYRDYLNNTY